jgi:outer membrane protein assembly factor BamB
MRGDLFTGIGNSEPEPNETRGYGEAVVELSPSFKVLAFDRPFVPSAAEDTDLGGAPVLFEPHGCPPLAAVNGKAGALYVWRRDHLGAGPFLSLPLSDGTTAFVGEPAWSPRTQTLYDAGATFFFGGRRLGDGVIAVRFRRGCSVRKVWSAVVGGAFQPPPLVAGDVVVATGGRSGGFEAHAAANGVRLWRFPTMAATLEPPIEARGIVFAGDSAGNAYAFRARR